MVVTCVFIRGEGDHGIVNDAENDLNDHRASNTGQREGRIDLQHATTASQPANHRYSHRVHTREYG